MLATGLMVAYGYVFETFTAWYSGDIFEQYLVINRTIEGWAITLESRGWSFGCVLNRCEVPQVTITEKATL
jgi:hypothetical protein